jgi:hypothetical protein
MGTSKSLLHKILRVSLLTLAVTGLATTATAQFRGGIEGTITDATGASISGATVTVTSQETTKSQQVTTDPSGFYRVSGLSPGRYTVDVSFSGFQSATIKDIAVNAEEVRGQNVTLQPGAVTESITVSAEGAPQLQTENGNLTGQITNAEIHALPQVGRDPYNLIRLAPGVFGEGARSGNGNSSSLPNTGGPGGSNTSIFQTENQVPISANGQRVADNSFQIDGVSVNSLGYGGAAVVTPNQESIKEMKVTTNAYDAQYGRNSGAQIEVVSQNGTNQVHGSAFFKYDQPGLNAFNKYGTSSGGPPQRVENAFRNFGGSAGGPILKNKLFFFTSYEGLRNRSVASASTAYVETPQYVQAVIAARPDSTTAKILQTPGMQPRIAAILAPSCSGFAAGACQVVGGGIDLGSITGAPGQYVDFVNNPTGGGLDNVPDLQNVLLSVPNTASGNQYNGRVDFQHGNDSFAVSTYITRLNTLGADAGAAARPIADVAFKPFNSAATLTWNRILGPTMLNQTRINFTRFHDDGLQDAAKTNFGIPEVQVESFPIARPTFGPTRSESTPAIFAQNTIEFRDTLNKVIGNHGARAGIEIRKEQDNNNLLGGARPLYSFSGMWNLANDTPIFEAINTDPRTGAPGNAQKYFRTSAWGLFLQDDWKVRPNLTLNLGLRWEYFAPLSEHRDQLTNIIFPAPGDLAGSSVRPVPQLYQKDWTNFAPRLGFAYNPAFANKLVVRGGFGLFYDRIPDAVFTNTHGNPPYFARDNICCGTSSDLFGTPFANGQIQYVLGANNSPLSYPINPKLANGIDPVTGGLCLNPGCNPPGYTQTEIWGAAPNMEVPYVYEYSFGIQYALPRNWVAAIEYQGSASHRLTRIVNQGFLYSGNPAFYAVYFPMDDVNANFNALNTRFTHQFAHGLQTEFRYRYSKSIDELSYGDSACGCGNQTYPQVLKSERGPSDYDTTHFITWSGLYDLPIFRNDNGLLGKVVGGWQISGIMTWHTGFPWTPVSGTGTETPGGPTLAPTRPTSETGLHPLNDSSNDAFTRPGGNFPGRGGLYFDYLTPGPPGIGRNSFRGPHYWATDLSLAKQFRLSGLRGTGRFFGEAAMIEVLANAFNIFNQLNLQPFGFDTNATHIDRATFGQADAGLAGRVVEFQARLSF